jgi:flagellar hook protein FlgE
MAFNTALSGLNAANADLKITGNNIANASTTGFKYSRAEFGDVYASTILGAGTNVIGSGVRLQDVAQQFTQGNISFTENSLDLAISGSGFFVLNNGGSQVYSRAGAFGLDKDGYVVNGVGAKLQGFNADATGNVSGVLDDVLIQSGNQPPRLTTRVESSVNLNAVEDVLERTGSTFATDGNVIGVTQVGLQQATTSTVTGAATPYSAFDFSAGSVTFDITLAGASSGNNGTVPITLSAATGVPDTIANYNDARTLAGIINSQIYAPPQPAEPIDVLVTAVGDGAGGFYLKIAATGEGEASEITLSGADLSAIGFVDGATDDSGTPEVTNGYPAQSIDFTGPDGDVVTYTSTAGASAGDTAAELSVLGGVSATATTSASILASNYNNATGDMVINLNGVALTSDTLAGLAQEINSLTNSILPGISATYNSVTGNLDINSSVGDDLSFAITSTTDGDSIEVVGNTNANSQILEYDANNTLAIAGAQNASTNAIVVGGTIELIMDEGYTAANASPPAIGLFGALTPETFETFTLNAFNPDDQATYNHATSLPIYDSLGNSHIMTQYFVKQEYDSTDAASQPNHWVMYVQIDGENVGDPDTTLPPPLNTQPTMAGYDIYFDADGGLNTSLSDQVLISNWQPLAENGEPTGALGPLNVLQGGAVPVADPPSSSNFVIDLSGTTQYGSSFAVNDVDQDGYTTGRLSGMSIDDEGFIFAQYTNGESQVLAQIALANFPNEQGLQAVGDTMWAASYDSGEANIGAPGSAALGVINSGALEESNVDLSAQLVNLIIAQRNYQANAKTIETADQTTQTIINLR